MRLTAILIITEVYSCTYTEAMNLTVRSGVLQKYQDQVREGERERRERVRERGSPETGRQDVTEAISSWEETGGTRRVAGVAMERETGVIILGTGIVIQ